MGSVFKDLKGLRFERLTVLEFAFNKQHQSYWVCSCKCGNTKTISKGSLLRGNTRSCGCLNMETRIAQGKKNKKHGGYGTALYNVWHGILSRCRDVNCPTYKLYGARGITVCDQWLDFSKFKEDVGERPGKEYSIDRIDNNKGYYKENCKWSTRKEQARNTKLNLLLTYKEETLCAIEWAEKYKLRISLLYTRLKRGWSLEKIINKDTEYNLRHGLKT